MKKKLAPGVYVQADGTLHLFVNEMLEANGYADTPENRQTLIDAAREMAATIQATYEEEDDWDD